MHVKMYKNAEKIVLEFVENKRRKNLVKKYIQLYTIFLEQILGMQLGYGMGVSKFGKYQRSALFKLTNLRMSILKIAINFKMMFQIFEYEISLYSIFAFRNSALRNMECLYRKIFPVFSIQMFDTCVT